MTLKKQKQSHAWTNYIIKYNKCVKFSYMEKSVYDFLKKESHTGLEWLYYKKKVTFLEY